MLIEVFSDFSCPWCFIGRRRFHRAQAMRPHLSMQLTWQPFQLNPEFPPEGVDRPSWFASRFGDLARIRSMERTLEESGARDGIRFAFDRIARVPNTMRAHRLMRYASRSGLDPVLSEQLFSAYFEKGEDIGNIDILVQNAVAVGLEAQTVREFLNGAGETDAVASMDELGHRSGISGVPYFIFDRRYALAGAQEPASFLPLFDALANEDQAVLETSA